MKHIPQDKKVKIAISSLPWAYCCFIKRKVRRMKI